MLDHDNRVREEFTRQAETFSASAAITDAALTQRFVTALERDEFRLRRIQRFRSSWHIRLA